MQEKVFYYLQLRQNFSKLNRKQNVGDSSDASFQQNVRVHIISKRIPILQIKRR
jgi:hypothetical protein